MIRKLLEGVNFVEYIKNRGMLTGVKLDGGLLSFEWI